MAWTYSLEQQKDMHGNNIPLWTVTQWNTDNPKNKWSTTITQAVKEIAYD
jgi:hypothetical protein